MSIRVFDRGECIQLYTTWFNDQKMTIRKLAQATGVKASFMVQLIEVGEDTIDNHILDSKYVKVNRA